MAVKVIRKLRNLFDVTWGPPNDGDVATYDQATDKVVFAPPTGVGGGAPDTADYLVGTAQAGLSAEIVVGASPGGELGGTWASPTVDAVHSGSSHAATQAAAEATAAAALSSHETDQTNVHGIADTSALALAANHVLLAPATDARNVIVPTLATVVALTLRGAVSQSEKLLIVQDSDLDEVLSVGPSGAVMISPSDPAVNALVVNANDDLGVGGYLFALNFALPGAALPAYGAYTFIEGTKHIGVMIATSFDESDPSTPIAVAQLSPGNTYSYGDGTGHPLGAGVNGVETWWVASGGHEILKGLAAISDGGVGTSERAQWFDDAVGAPKLRFKMRDSAGTLVTGISASEAFVVATLDAHVNDTTDAHDAAAISFTPNGSIAATDVQAAIQEVRDEAGGGGAPTTADYLVGTTQGGLSAEIVVGTSPGGELGGTWASPTVDATHSGSSHASVQAAAEATAAAALSTHESDTTSVHGIADTSALAVAANHPLLAPASSARNVIQPTAGAVIAAIVKAHASQSVDLTQWQASDATVVAAINELGALRAIFDWTGAGVTGGQLFDSAYGVHADIKRVLTADNDGQTYGMYGVLTADGPFKHGYMYGLAGFAIHEGTEATVSAGNPWLTGVVGWANAALVGDGYVRHQIGGYFAPYTGAAGSGHDVSGIWADVTFDAVSFPGSGNQDSINGIQSFTNIYQDPTSPALPQVVGIRINNAYDADTKVDNSFGLFVEGNYGAAGVTNAYGIYVSAQSGAANTYGIYVAGGKSLFVDTLLLGKIAAPADGDIANSQGGWWWDQANSVPKWKGKTSGGSVVNFTPSQASDITSAISTHESDTTSVHGITDTSTLYRAGGTDVALADGGTGASLTDPNADRIAFWDDSAGQMTWLAPGTNLTITGTTIDATGGSTAADDENLILHMAVFA